MSPTEARNLLPQTVVMYDNDPNDKGIVLEVLRNGFSVRWADGMVGVVLFRDAQWINHWQPKATVQATHGEIAVKERL
jgi:hypothetical protein